MAMPLESPAVSSRLNQPKQHIRDLDAAFWEGATFLPLDQPSRIDALLQRVRKSHQAAFVAFLLGLSTTHPELCEQTGVYECFETFKLFAVEQRRQLIEHPPFIVWLKMIMSCTSENELRERLPDLKRIMATFEASRNGMPFLTMNGMQVQLARFDVDPLIRMAALPEYEFPDEKRRREFGADVAYPISFFAEMITLALERIRRAWPAVHLEFSKVVKLVVDMVDSDFTSYSAYSHVGVIFVSTDNSPLVALEEYLIHEFGHQILYNVMELDPVIIDESEEMFTLPWSGQERDLLGYFHAFYIYTFLAHFLRRINNRSKREQRRVSSRFTHVVRGLKQAGVELEELDRFTPIGRHLFENLKHITPSQ